MLKTSVVGNKVSHRGAESQRGGLAAAQMTSFLVQSWS